MSAETSFFDESIPSRARIYILSIIAVGLSVFVYSLYRSLSSDPRWIYLAGLTLLTSCFPVKISLLNGKGQSLSITVSDVFVFSGILFFGPEAGAVIAVVEGLISSLRGKVSRLYKRLFNLALLAIVAFVAGQAFYRMQQAPPPLDSVQEAGVALLIVRITFAAFIYFGINSMAVALAISLVTHKPLIPLWKQNFLWAVLANCVNALTALLVAIYFRQIGFYVSIAVAILPVLFVFYYAHKFNLSRVRQAGGSTP